MKKTKKMLSTALVGIIGLSMLTSPVFAAAGGSGVDIGDAGSITVNYSSLTQVDDDLSNKVGPENTVIDTDFGYAWDDLSFTYVQTLGGAESTLTTDEGYVLSSAKFQSGTWYKGAYSNVSELDPNMVLPNIPVPNAVNEIHPGADVTAEEFANLPKIVLHNYTVNNASFGFGVASADQDVFNANGMLGFVNESRAACEVTEATGTLNGNSTITFGIIPIGSPGTKDFSPFTVGLTISIANN